MREHIRDETIDLIYLDPPFNSSANYNVLFKSPQGQNSDAQIEAFEDTWHWNEQAEREFGELTRQPNTDVSEMMQALRRFLGENDMMAYLTMMANRLLELHRALKPTGSLYLHCDPTASHYLKIVLDGVFGKENFRNEIIWSYKKWAVAETKFSRNHDVILFYAKSNSAQFNILFQPRAASTLKRFGNKKIVSGHDDEGKRTPSITLDEESGGVKMSDVWELPIIAPSSSERLGYPTQKPLALLERIINASSNEGDIILDPFCGCGTAVHAAQKLKRQWIGIDITHLAVSLIEKRIKDAFPSVHFEVHGTPKDFAGARDLAERDKYQFQWWACSLVNAQPYQGKKKGADGGIDGLIYFNDDGKLPKKIIISVKGGEHVSRTMVADLKNAVDRDKAQLGLFVTLTKPTRPMKDEASAAGFYDSPAGSSFPKIQLLTIEGLLTGSEQARYPDLARGGLTFKKAKIEEKMVDQKNLF
ncbi:MAG TPA: DNA methyltransferase [Sulfuricella sp.]|nr:DNA methyltransferase [Sulfuricella sp.]